MASSRRSLGAAAASAALFSSCDVLLSAQAFSPPLHAGIPPAVSQSPVVCGSQPNSVPTSLQRIRIGSTSSRTANIVSLQSSFIEEPPKKLRPKSDDHGEASSIDSDITAATPLDKDIDELVQKQSDTEKARLLDSLASIASNLAEKVGAVDESRIAFHEISTGEVPRLYRYSDLLLLE